jgi:type IV pilus assembly protein PilE
MIFPMKHVPRTGRVAAGFTLVELMIVVAIIGILSAVAIPSMSRYVKKSRTSEAPLHLAKMWSGALAYYESDHADAGTTLLPKSFPRPAANAHECTGMPCASPAFCCGAYPSGRCPANPPIYSNPATVYPTIAFNIPSEHHFVPLYLAGAGTEHDVELHVYGNLDCDALPSQFIIRGSARATWGNASSALVDPWRSPMYILREIE